MAQADDDRPDRHRPAPLWREMVGKRLRRLRHERDERLVDVAGRAGVSVQYLSEVERGQKEPSSEVVEALCAAFGLTVLDLAAQIVEDNSAGAIAPAPSAAARATDVFPILMAA
jgi:transcriptional regulator with XRE-family HTH domain